MSEIDNYEPGWKDLAKTGAGWLRNAFCYGYAANTVIRRNNEEEYWKDPIDPITGGTLSGIIVGELINVPLMGMCSNEALHPLVRLTPLIPIATNFASTFYEILRGATKEKRKQLSELEQKSVDGVRVQEIIAEIDEELEDISKGNKDLDTLLERYSVPQTNVGSGSRLVRE